MPALQVAEEPTEPAEPAVVTIGALLDSLGPQMLRPLALPRGDLVQICAAVIHDVEHSGSGLEGAVLLVPGRPAPELLSWAAERGAAAVVVRASSIDLQGWTDAAEAVGVAVMDCASAASWGQLYTLIDTLFAMTMPVPESDGSRNTDLFTLANDIALRAGGAVAIEDLAMRVLAYSTIPGQEVDDTRRDAILGRRVPAHPTNAEEYSAVLRSTGAVWSTEPAEHSPRLAIAIRDRGEALGTIWVIQGSAPLTDEARDVLEEGARQAAPQLARFTLAANMERRQRAERLARLVHGAGSSRELGHFFGLGHDVPSAVLVIGRGAARGEGMFSSSAESSSAYLSDLLRTGLAAYRIPAAASSLEGQAVAVVNAPAEARVLRSIIDTVLSQAADRLGGSWRAGLSRTLSGLAEAPRGLIQARQALDVVSHPFGRGPVGEHAMLGPQLLLLEAYDGLQAQGAVDGEPLSLLLAHDASAGTSHVESVRGWIAANHDVVVAAKRLMLHPNTLRYRLRKIAEIIDLEDPDSRLALMLQLRMHEIRTVSEG